MCRSDATCTSVCVMQTRRALFVARLVCARETQPGRSNVRETEVGVGGGGPRPHAPRSAPSAIVCRRQTSDVRCHIRPVAFARRSVHQIRPSGLLITRRSIFYEEYASGRHRPAPVETLTRICVGKTWPRCLRGRAAFRGPRGAAASQ